MYRQLVIKFSYYTDRHSQWIYLARLMPDHVFHLLYMCYD